MAIVPTAKPMRSEIIHEKREIKQFMDFVLAHLKHLPATNHHSAAPPALVLAQVRSEFAVLAG